MANNKEIRSTAKFVLSFVLYKYKIIKEELQVTDESALKEFIWNLKNIVWIESHFACAEWRNFLKKHFDHMISSPKLYATYVTFACYLKNENCQNGFDCFLNTLTIVTVFAVYAHRRGHPEFQDISIEIFRAFYEKEVRQKFYDQGGWKKFSKFLQERPSLQSLNAVNLFTNTVKTPSEVTDVIHLQFPDSHMVSNCILKDISETIVETHKQTFCLLETIPGVLEKTSQLEITNTVSGKIKKDELVKHLKELHDDDSEEIDDSDDFNEFDLQMDRERYKSELMNCSKGHFTIHNDASVEIDEKDTCIDIVKTDIASINLDLLISKLMKRMEKFQEKTITSVTEKPFQQVTGEQLREKLKLSKQKCVELVKYLNTRRAEIADDASVKIDDEDTSVEIVKTNIALVNFDPYKLIKRVRTFQERTSEVKLNSTVKKFFPSNL